MRWSGGEQGRATHFNELSAGALRSTRGQQVNASTSALKASARIRADHFCVRAQHRYRGRRGDWRGPQAQLRLKRAPGSEHQPQRGLGRGAEGGLGFVVEAVVLETARDGPAVVGASAGGQGSRRQGSGEGQHRRWPGDGQGRAAHSNRVKTAFTSRAEASAFAPSSPTPLP